MVKQGLLEELTKFHKLYNANRIDISNRYIDQFVDDLKQNKTYQSSSKPDYLKGIFQSIGFKEFHNYLMLTDDQKASEEGIVLFNKSLEDLKLVTRRYARKQMRWITNRFLGQRERDVCVIFRYEHDVY